MPDLETVTDQAVHMTPEVLSAVRLCGKALDDALSANKGSLASLIASEPGRAELQQIMAQLGVDQALRIIGWIFEERLPDAETLVAGLLRDDATGAGQFLHASLARAARPLLLARLFAPERLADLLTASTRLSQMQEAA